MGTSSFVRTKTINENDYYYRIHRTYENGGQREKSEYLGPVDKLDIDEETGEILEDRRKEEPESQSTEEKEEKESGSEEMNEEAVKRLTRQGAMVERDAAYILTMEDVEMIEGLETTPMYVSDEMVYRLREKEDYGRSREVEDPEMVEVMVINDTPKFKGVDGKDYPATVEGDILEVPEENAEILVNRGNAEYLEDPEKEGEEMNDSSDQSQSGVEYDQNDEMEGLKMLILSEMPEEGSIRKDELREEVDEDGFDEALERLKSEGSIFEPKQYHVQKI